MNASRHEYVPNYQGPARSFTACFQKLGFKINPRSELKRENFIAAMKKQVDSSDLKYLKPTNNEVAFSVMVDDFLVQHGSHYWGVHDRDHLEEEDSSKGYLYPRDADRPISNLMDGVRTIFWYKAKNCVLGKEQNLGPGWIADHFDFTALSGKQADAPNTMNRILPKVSKSKADGQDSGEDRNDAKPTYNFLDVVEIEDRLRPSHHAHAWTREAVDEDSEYMGDEGYLAKPSIKRRIILNNKIEQGEEDAEIEQNLVAKPKTKIHRAKTVRNKVTDPQQNQKKLPKEKINKAQRPRQSAPDLTSREIRPATDPKVHMVTQPTSAPQPNSSSDSDQPLFPKRQRLPPITPPESQAASRAPTAFKDRPIINLDDDVKPTQGCKAESWSTEVISQTFLRVSADNIPLRGPIRVPLSYCRTSESLFTNLLSERKVPQDVRSRVSDVTIAFPWNKETFGIRKGRPEDWVYFSESLRKAWEKESHRFIEGCNIDVMIHVDEN